MKKTKDDNGAGTSLLLVILAGLVSGCAGTITQEKPPTSSYACEPSQAKSEPSAGKGEYGCQFRLLHPETGKLMVNTAYSLDVFAVPTHTRNLPLPVASLKGVTDAQGRSGVVRAPFPITPDRMRFVERLGDGPYGLSPRLLNPIDGKAIPRSRYHAKWCGGPAFHAMTDEQGNGVMFSSKDETCRIKVDFYKRAGEY